MAPNKSIQFQGYRWIIEEDRTFYVDPNCIGIRDQPAAREHIKSPNFGTDFHTSYMPVIATGCTDEFF